MANSIHAPNSLCLCEPCSWVEIIESKSSFVISIFQRKAGWHLLQDLSINICVYNPAWWVASLSPLNSIQLQLKRCDSTVDLNKQTLVDVENSKAPIGDQLNEMIAIHASVLHSNTAPSLTDSSRIADALRIGSPSPSSSDRWLEHHRHFAPKDTTNDRPKLATTGSLSLSLSVSHYLFVCPSVFCLFALCLFFFIFFWKWRRQRRERRRMSGAASATAAVATAIRLLTSLSLC